MFRRIFWIIVVLLIALLVALFAYYNQEISTLKFMSWEVTMSSAFIYIGIFALGIILSFILLLPNMFMQKWHISRMHSYAKKLQKLVDTLSENNKLTEEQVVEKEKQLEELTSSMQKYEKQNMLMSNFSPKSSDS